MSTKFRFMNWWNLITVKQREKVKSAESKSSPVPHGVEHFWPEGCFQFLLSPVAASQELCASQCVTHRDAFVAYVMRKPHCSSLEGNSLLLAPCIPDPSSPPRSEVLTVLLGPCEQEFAITSAKSDPSEPLTPGTGRGGILLATTSCRCHRCHHKPSSSSSSRLQVQYLKCQNLSCPFGMKI